MSTETDRRDLTLLGLLQDHLECNRKRLAWNTLTLTERAFKSLVQEYGDIPVRMMTLRMAERWQVNLLQRFPSPTSANIFVKIVRAVFSRALRQGLVKDNMFDLTLAKVMDEPMRIYEPWEIRALVDAAPDLVWKGRILGAATAGLRRSETVTLTIYDVDFIHELIHVQAKKETPTTTAWEPKGRRARAVPLVPMLADVLRQRTQQLPPGQPYLLLHESRYFALQQGRKNGGLSGRVRAHLDENFGKPFHRIRLAAGVAEGSFHDLRRTMLTQLAEAGYPEHWLQALAGHTDPKTTQRFYLAIRQQPMLAAANTILSEQYHSQEGVAALPS